MIPNNESYVALYKAPDCNHADCEGSNIRPIVAWDTQGRPMVVANQGLVPANVIAHFVGVRYAPHWPTSKYVPAQDARMHNELNRQQREAAEKESQPFKPRFSKLAEEAINKA